MVTCGAKAGDSATTRRTGPDETTSPSASTTHVVGDLGDELHVVGGDQDRRPSAAMAAQRRGEGVLDGVVEPARRLVEEQHGRRAGEHEGQREREPLTLREVTGMGSPSMPGTSRVRSAAVAPLAASSSATVSR